MNKKSVYLGNIITTSDNNDIATEYLMMAQTDERTADLLYRNHLSNQSVYFYIQAMEKYLKHYICKKINVLNTYFAEELRSVGHSLDAAVDFYINIMSGNNEALRCQLMTQIKNNIFGNIKFSVVYNATRYPYYSNRTSSYRITRMTDDDCQILHKMCQQLKDFLEQMYVLI